MEECPLQQLLILSLRMECQLGLTVSVPERCLMFSLPSPNRLRYCSACVVIRTSVASVIREAQIKQETQLRADLLQVLRSLDGSTDVPTA